MSFKAVRCFGKSGKGPKLAKKLTDVGIWIDIETGWEIVGYLDHNPSKAEVLAKREAARARKDAYRKGAPLAGVPASVPMGHDTGRARGQDAGQQRPSLACAPVPAGGIRSAALHGTTINKIPEPVVVATEHERPRLTAFEEPFWKAAWNAMYFAMNPANGGRPARLARQMARAEAYPGWR